MKVSCDEGVASYVGLESCEGDRKVAVEALTGEGAGTGTIWLRFNDDRVEAIVKQ